nr:MAG TPA: hypothetical protein [Caudoviricetes sp.]
MKIRSLMIYFLIRLLRMNVWYIRSIIRKLY